jgi:hypothetical protein
MSTGSSLIPPTQAHLSVVTFDRRRPPRIGVADAHGFMGRSSLRHPLARRERAPHSVLLVRAQRVFPAGREDWTARTYLLGGGFLCPPLPTGVSVLGKEHL